MEYPGLFRGNHPRTASRRTPRSPLASVSRGTLWGEGFPRRSMKVRRQGLLTPNTERPASARSVSRLRSTSLFYLVAEPLSHPTPYVPIYVVCTLEGLKKNLQNRDSPDLYMLVWPSSGHVCVPLKAGDGEAGGSPRAATASGGVAAPSFPAHAELRKVAENLSTLRMRQARTN